ncbi:MAG: bifunctional adenosylcobinamide kinase/adenosylcobinamide-phosphate guanylyltransferase [Oscillospiraceae bacterium]|nr:bifunctional adenosylcobinamide kinase/adenosylcobinamide-phosphate guanylyltransferase [Oscillospiraceae bacterium]
MDLIIGGAYQGKLDYAVSTYGFNKDDIHTCSDDIVFARCVDHLERWTLACVRRGEDPIERFAADPSAWSGCVIICEDISCGVVPTDADMRSWREANGRLLNWLSLRADSVTRLFCGIPQRLRR